MEKKLTVEEKLDVLKREVEKINDRLGYGRKSLSDVGFQLDSLTAKVKSTEQLGVILLCLFLFIKAAPNLFPKSVDKEENG
jgi:hypothetical protein